MAQHPWGPEAERLLGLAKEASLDTAGEWLTACRAVYRERQEERERAAVAREIRRLVAVSGLSQRDFASHIGTSASRLSTYVTGRVTPSATMMMRIQRAARRLQKRRDEE
ncbi:helix-turn-helix transcriptional regulator [Nocardioides sp. TF02-7]|uniref:helix-turn-helix domain-containing protein n=1 Tax=Nocardioides sp. TF02-7 TaxID=2917724 RepID=UPI001F05D8E3|nr:helix-turn-helix transcriptional regulator [Nocardioides sp. TF02-7]UMG91580.1 helix-turn-helix domain-containing protein [Nocardioides sp. TF02-7]